MYAIEATPVKAADVIFIALAVPRAFVKAFNTYAVSGANDCKLFMGIEPANELIFKRKRNFKSNTVLQFNRLIFGTIAIIILQY